MSGNRRPCAIMKRCSAATTMSGRDNSACIRRRWQCQNARHAKSPPDDLRVAIRGRRWNGHDLRAITHVRVGFETDGRYDVAPAGQATDQLIVVYVTACTAVETARQDSNVMGHGVRSS